MNKKNIVVVVLSVSLLISFSISAVDFGNKYSEMVRESHFEYLRKKEDAIAGIKERWEFGKGGVKEKGEPYPFKIFDYKGDKGYIVNPTEEQYRSIIYNSKMNDMFTVFFLSGFFFGIAGGVAIVPLSYIVWMLFRISRKFHFWLAK